MHQLIVVAGIVAFAQTARVEGAKDRPRASCASLAACLTALDARHAARTGCCGNVDETLRGVAAGLAALDPPRVDALIRLLDHEDEAHRDVAAFALALMGHEAKLAVPTLVRHFDDTGYAAYALGEIGDAAAVGPLVARMQDGTGPAEQALAKLGAPAATALVVIVINERAPRERRFAAARVLGEMPPAAQGVVVDSLRGAVREKRTQASADEIVGILAGFRDVARSAIPEVRALFAVAEESRKDWLLWSLMRLGDDSVAEAIALRAREMTGYQVLYALRALEDAAPHARGAVPVLIDLLRRGQWDARHVAARVLGAIGDERAIEPLIENLASSDWRVMREAARALRRFGKRASASDPRLSALATTHWSNVVRNAAAVTLSVVRDGSDTGADDPTRYPQLQRETSCMTENRLDPHFGSYRPPTAVLVKDAWRAIDKSWGPRSETRSKVPTRIAESERGLISAFEVPNGWLLGFNRGEWGGEAVFLGVDDQEHVLIGTNVFTFVKVSGKIFAVTGLAHLGLDSGTLYRVAREGATWRATPVIELPAAPQGVYVDGERLLVSTMDDVASIDVRDGDIKLLDCR